MVRSLLNIAVALLLTTSVQASDIVYNLGAGTTYYGTGQSRNETYDVALRISDPALVGCQVTGVRIYLSSVDGISATKAWLSKDIAVKSMKFTGADVETVDFEAVKGNNEVAFTPYTITDEGLYVGYTLTAAKDVATQPIRLCRSYSADGFFIHTSGLYRSGWRSIGLDEGSLAIEVLLSGDFSDHAATAIDVPEVNAKTNSQNQIDFLVKNQGTKGLQSIDYTIEVGGATADYHADLNPAVAGYYGRTYALTANLPMVTTKGGYPINVEVTRVNGQPNASTTPVGSGFAKFYNLLPVKRPVCEEFTGLWCGWCPRGFVGMERMAEKYGDDFVGICYHNADAMEIMSSSNFPASIPGFPAADLDRAVVIDPNLHDIELGWSWYREQFAPLAVDVATELDGDNLNVTAYVVSPLDMDDDRYQLSFVLKQDGMQNSTWQQANYYGGRDDLRDGVMDWFCDQGSYVSGLVYNDVIVAWSGRDGIEGSLPEHYDGDVTYSYTYTFDLNGVVNTSGKNLVQDRSKLTGIALVIDKTTGEIVNAHQALAGTSTVTAIDRPATSPDEVVTKTQFFDLQGRRVLSPAPGSMLIRSETLRNGQVRTRKVIY